MRANFFAPRTMTDLRSHRIRQTAPYAFAEVDKKVSELKAKGVQVIDFGVGDPLDPPPDFVIEALKSAAHKRSQSGYPSYIGDPSFRQAAADYLQRQYGVDCDPQTEITSTIGSKEAVMHFPLAFLEAGDLAICPTPGYPPYKIGTRYAGAEPYFTSLRAENDFLIDFQSIPKEVCQRAKIIWTNYPNSPTGALAPESWLCDLVAWAQEHEIIIAADEGCYHEIYFDETRPKSILEVTKSGVVAFYSLSKTFNMTGYRVGFAAGDASLISAFRQIKTQIDSGTPTFIQDAASVALQDSDFPRKNRDQYTQKRQLMGEILESTGLPPCPSESTFYLWQPAPEGLDGAALAEAFLSEGIVVTPGGWISDLDAEGINVGEQYVRLALMPSLEQIQAVKERLRPQFWL